MIDKLNLHYSFENPASVYDEEALTALELAGRQGAKINEVVGDQNALRQETESHLATQDRTIQERMDTQDNNIEHIRTVTVPEDVDKEMDERIQDGTFDSKINAYMGDLKTRMDNLVGNIPEGSTTMDAEIIDSRLGHNGTTYENLGTANRKQFRELNDKATMVSTGNSFLFRKLSKLIETVNIELVPNTFYDTQGETPILTPFTGRYGTAEISVKATENYYIQVVRGTSNKTCCVVFVDADNNMLWKSANGNKKEQYENMFLRVPTGATKMLITSTSSVILEKRDFRDGLIFHGILYGELGLTSAQDAIYPGYYQIKQSELSHITDLPEAMSNGGILVSYPWGGDGRLFQIIYEVNRGGRQKEYTRWVLEDGVEPWDYRKTSEYDLTGLNVAVIGDSISTNGNAGTDANVPEMIITEADVGVELSAYLTYYDVEAGLTLGGHSFTSSEIGTEVYFTPTSEDVGKYIGLPKNYNANSKTVWWEVVKNEMGCNVIPACWSGSSITSHESDEDILKCSHAWHDSQIRKCGIRTPGTMERTAPDVIIIYRGTNDFSHTPYVTLTEGYFESNDFVYPETDELADGSHGLKEGYTLLIKKLRAVYPKAKIFLCTMNVFKRVSYANYPTRNGLYTLPQFNNAIREIADFMGCGVIEFDKDGITFENCYSEGYIVDSATTPTHPSDKGHGVMGNKAIVDLKAQFSHMS